MSEGGRRVGVKEGGDRRVLARLVELGTLLGVHARRGVESKVDLRRELNGEVNVHEHAGALLLGWRRRGKMRLGGRWRGGCAAGRRSRAGRGRIRRPCNVDERATVLSPGRRGRLRRGSWHRGGWVVQLDGGGEALEVRRRSVGSTMRWKRVYTEQRRMKGSIERGRPRIRIRRRGDEGTCPSEGNAALVNVLGRGVGGWNAGVGEESDVLRSCR